VGDPSCPICQSGRPRAAVAELEGVWVTIPETAALPGYVCLVAKRHVREPFELPQQEREAFWRDIDRVAEALHSGLRPEKMNYEIHGNTIPHLHMHLFPRWEGDRFAGKPIDGRAGEPRTKEDRDAVLDALASLVR
jgi:diadenosine tetraphosphate (Ap4A) HIT family hydrolase